MSARGIPDPGPWPGPWLFLVLLTSRPAPRMFMRCNRWRISRSYALADASVWLCRAARGRDGTEVRSWGQWLVMVKRGRKGTYSVLLVDTCDESAALDHIDQLLLHRHARTTKGGVHAV